MEINNVIAKLNEFKKVADMIGACDLVGFDDTSFTVKVKIENDVPERIKVTGFSSAMQVYPKTKSKKARHK